MSRTTLALGLAVTLAGAGLATRTPAEAASPSPLAAQDTTGKAIFAGKGLCSVCHGPEAKGTPLAPDLTDAEWLNVDGSIEQITELIAKGVATPRKFPTPMPARGGAPLTDAEVQAVARYVFSLSQPKK